MKALPLVKVNKAVVFDKYSGQLAVPEGTIGTLIAPLGNGMFVVEFDKDSPALYNGDVKQWFFEGHELEVVGGRVYE